MSVQTDSGLLLLAAEWAWEHAVKGLPGWDTAAELAGPAPDSRKGVETRGIEVRIDELISSQKSRAFAAGMLGKLGETLPLPFPVPAGLALSLFVQLRLAGAIARLRGYDLNDDRVKAVCMACLCRASVSEMLWKAGTGIGMEVTPLSLDSLSRSALEALNREIGNRLAARLGGKSLWGLGKTLPLIGGLLSGASDSMAVAAVGALARKTLNPARPALSRQ